MELNELGFFETKLQLDHLCFRVETAEQYADYKKLFSKNGILITEILVNGRNVSTFRLRQAFESKHFKVDIIELPEPKLGSSYPLGFEHVEFVTRKSFSKLTSDHPKLEFKISGQKNITQELCLKLKTGQAKFHYCSLERVIEIEESKIQDVIFDLDGTLVDAMDHVLEIIRVSFSEILKRDITIDEVKQKHQFEFSKLFEAFGIEKDSDKKQALKRWTEISKKLKYHFLENIHSMLHELKKTHLNFHLWTAREEESAMYMLKELGIESYFKTMSFSNIQNSKPNPLNLNFNFSNALKNSYVMVGDSSTDMKAAKNINAIAVAALWDKHAVEENLVASNGELYFKDVSDFTQWILSRT